MMFYYKRPTLNSGLARKALFNFLLVLELMMMMMMMGVKAGGKDNVLSVVVSLPPPVSVSVSISDSDSLPVTDVTVPESAPEPLHVITRKVAVDTISFNDSQWMDMDKRLPEEETEKSTQNGGNNNHHNNNNSSSSDITENVETSTPSASFLFALHTLSTSLFLQAKNPQTSLLEQDLYINRDGKKNLSFSVSLSTVTDSETATKLDADLDVDDGDVNSNANVSTVVKHKSSYRIDFFAKPLWEIAFSVATAAANILIVFIICMAPKFRRKTNVLIANLCMASTFYTVIILVRVMEYKLGWKLEYKRWRLCEVFAIFHRFPFPVLSFTTLAISYERSKSAVASVPFYPPSRTSTGLKIVVIWLAAVTAAFPSALSNVFDSSGLSDPVRKCKKVLILNNYTVHCIYVAFYVLAVFCIPAIVLMIEFIRMISKVRFLLFRRPPSRRRSTSVPSCRTDERLRLVRNACLFTGLFIVFWIPIGIELLIYDLPEELFPTKKKLQILVSMRNIQLITDIFMFSVPVFLFLIMMSRRLRDSCLSCLCSFCLLRSPD